MVEIKNCNLPHEEFQFRSRPFFIEVELLSFDIPSKNLALDILQYNLASSAERNSRWENQSPKDHVSELTFVNISWPLFESCLSYFSSQAKDLIPSNPNFSRKPTDSSFIIKQKVSINQITIASGYFTYSKNVKWEDDKIEVEVPYPFLFKELNLVKHFFHKILKKKTIDIQLTLINQDGNIRIIKAESEDIQKINSDSIKVIRAIQFKEWKNNITPESMEGAFFNPSEENIINDFGNVDEFEKDLLFQLLEHEKIRNKAQLQYLSKISSTNTQLYLTIDPQFGFVFIFYGEQMTHCIWELINSHASYVWSMNSLVFNKNELNQLSAEIEKINNQGRAVYKAQFEPSSDLFFNTINHKAQKNPMTDHFGKWRLALEKLLV